MVARCFTAAALLVFPSLVMAQCAIWSAPENVSNLGGVFNVDGNLAIDASGNVHLVYQSFLDSSGDNYYIHNTGGTWSSRVNLGSMGGKGSTPKIVITPDNQLHAFFGKNNLYWRTKPVSGGSWSAAEQVAIDPTGGNFISAVAVDSSGGIYPVWGHLFDNAAPVRNGIYGRYKPLGGAWQATELIYGNTNDANWPKCTDIAAKGTTLWCATRVNSSSYILKKSAAGAWPAGPGTLFRSGADALTFAISPVGNEVAAVYQDDNDNAGNPLCTSNPCEDTPWFEIWARYSSNDGASWSADDNISAMRNDIDRGPSAVYDSDGNFHVVWESFCCDHKLRMRYRSKTNGVWGSPYPFTSGVGGHIPHSLQAQGLNLFMTFSNTGVGPGLYDVMFARYLVGLTNMILSKSSLSHTITAGSSVASDTFTVTNGCSGTLSYHISTSAEWLTVSPDSGASTTDVDTITVSYPGAATLTAGNYNATITVSGNAWNAPKAIAVTLKVQTVKPDLDGDGDVDQSDFSDLQKCLSGPNVGQYAPACAGAHLDSDDDVDATDLDIMLGCYSGAKVIANMSCAALYPPWTEEKD